MRAVGYAAVSPSRQGTDAELHVVDERIDAATLRRAHALLESGRACSVA
jgi:hypothetical protein